MNRLTFVWAVVGGLLLAGCSQTQIVQATDRLTPCTGDDTPVDAYCGSFKVFENRATKQGRQIDLSIVVLPARCSFSPADRARAPPRWRK